MTTFSANAPRLPIIWPILAAAEAPHHSMCGSETINNSACRSERRVNFSKTFRLMNWKERSGRVGGRPLGTADNAGAAGGPESASAPLLSASPYVCAFIIIASAFSPTRTPALTLKSNDRVWLLLFLFAAQASANRINISGRTFRHLNTDSAERKLTQRRRQRLVHSEEAVDGLRRDVCVWFA
jgi:hypothetical protein